MKSSMKKTGTAVAVSVFLAFILGFLVYKSTGFIYAIADDVIMRDIVSGAFTGKPDGHLIFVQYALGWCLSKLYMLNTSVDWYGFLMVGTLFFGLAAVLYRGLETEKSWKWKSVYVLGTIGVFLIALVSHAAQFEWTISAASAGTAALYLYISAGKEHVKRIESILIFILLLLTYMIRQDVFWMVMPGFGLTFLWRFFKWEHKKWELQRKELLLPLLVFLAVGLVFVVEKNAYQGSEWEAFQKFQNARSDVYDYFGVPSYEVNSAFFEEQGISNEEVRALRHYALYLVDGMDADMMESLSQEAKRQNEVETSFTGKIKAAFSLAAKQFVSKEYWKASLSMLLFLVLSFICSYKREKGVWLFIILFFGMQAGLWFALGYIGRLPERVAFSLHLVLLGACAGLFMGLWSERDKDGRWEKRAAIILSMFSLVLAGIQWEQTCVDNQERLQADGSFQSFKNSCKEERGLYFIETYMAEPVGGAQVTVKGNTKQNRCLTLGDWYTTSPLDKERFAALGIFSVEETLLENEEAYLVVRDIEKPGFLETWLAWKYPQKKLVLAETRQVEGRFYYLYQIQE